MVKETYVQTKQNSGIGFKSFRMGPKTHIKNEVIDPLKKQQQYDHWKEKNKAGIGGINKGNSDIIWSFLKDMERGINVAKRSKKGKRSPARLNALACHLKRISELCEKYYKKDITELKREEVHELFDNMKDGTILTKKGTRYISPEDYIKDFICFWNWFRKVESFKREQEIIEKGKSKRKEVFDIVEYLERTRSENTFVYFTYEELKKVLPHLKKDYQILALFLFDSITRSPSEITNIYVNDLNFEGDEIYVTIREEASKTYGRKFNLILCEDKLKEYLRRKKLKPTDRLFPFYKTATFNKKMQKTFIKVFGDMMTEGNKPFSEITGYAFRHSGSCYLRSLKGITMDKLMVRGGWTSLKRINYYTKFLGLDGRIERDNVIEENSVNESLMRLVETQNKELSDLRHKITQLIEVNATSQIKVGNLPLQTVEVSKNV